MARFVVDAGVVLHLASTDRGAGPVHKLPAPTLLPPPALSRSPPPSPRGTAARHAGDRGRGCAAHHPRVRVRWRDVAWRGVSVGRPRVIVDDDPAGDWTVPGVYRCAPGVYRIPLPL